MEEKYHRFRYTTADPFYYSYLKECAKENRKCQTDEEELLWFHLSKNQLGVHFRRQHIIGCYIADFVCLKAKLIVEVDGGYHSQEKQKLQDYLRTVDLNAMGFEVIRFRNEEIRENLPVVLDVIFDKVVHNLIITIEQNN